MTDLKTLILEKTDNGLKIICELFNLPGDIALESEGKGVSKKKFHSPWRADDSNPSACLWKRKSDGVWGIKDWGDASEQNFRDCFTLYAQENNIHEYKLLFLELARKYEVELEGQTSPRRPEYKNLTLEECEDVIVNGIESTDSKGNKRYTRLIFMEDFTPEQVAVFNPKAVGKSDASKSFYNDLVAAMKYYNLRPVASFEVVKISGESKSGYRKSSHDNYPIFSYDFGKWGKIYEPYASSWINKEGVKQPPQRFQFYGKKPERFIYGLDKLNAEVDKFRNDEYERLLDEAAINKSDNTAETKREKNKLRRIAMKCNIPEVILCTGGSDGINLKAMGFPALWSNSETEFLLPSEMQEIKDYAEDVYYVGDLDKTGIEATHRIGMMYLHVRLIRLPGELNQRIGINNKPCKDVKDFARYYSPADFRGLLRTAYAYKFWQPRIDAKGQMRGYDFDIVNARHFLIYQGFYRYPNHTNKLAYEIVKLDDHVVSVQDGISIKNYLENFVFETRQEKQVVATVMKAKIIGEQLIHSLPQFNFPFTKGDKTSQYFFFKNKAWKITNEGVNEFKPVNGECFVWEKELLLPERNAPDIAKPFFTVEMEEGQPKLTVHRQDHPVMQYFINCSRIHWKKELDAAGVSYYEPNSFYESKSLNTLTGQSLTAEEQAEQVLHFLSKVTALGYFYHDHKQPSKAWLVWCTENAERETTSSFGGSGKSIFGNCIKAFLPNEYFEGRKVDTSTLFHLQNVTDKTRLIWYDDVAPGFTISPMFSSITGPMKIETKFGRATEIPFAKSAKYLVTSNFNLKDTDPSTVRRLWFLGWSDFYHAASSKHPGTKTISDDLGHQLFNDWSDTEWNGFINFVKDCIVAWLKVGRVDPPLRDIKQQTLRTIMGPNFMEWSESYLMEKINKRPAGSSEPNKIKADEKDIFIPKRHAEEDFTDFMKKRNMKAPTDTDFFKRKMEAFCEYHGFILNPPALKNSRGAIERRMDERHKKIFNLPDQTTTLNCYFILKYVSNEEYANSAPEIPDTPF